MQLQNTKHTGIQKVDSFINENILLCEPKDVYICNGSREEYDSMAQLLVESGSFTKLNDALWPHCFLARSDPADTARVEDRTFICCQKKEDAGPTNNWVDPKEMKATLSKLFKGSMHGRTMYVIPFSMGPIGSSFSSIGIQLTDSPYVVCNMFIMTRMGTNCLDHLKTQSNPIFVPCLHSVGHPLEPGMKDVAWPCDATHKYICHFPEERKIISYGSGYGGNALLGKKCFSLRIASVMGRDEGWLAEHMLILGITNPKGQKKYITGAFPSACGKTNLAMVQSRLPGWKIETVGDDIAWLRIGKDGRLRAVNPETGFFGVAPGTNVKTNKNAIESCRRDSIFTNVGSTSDGGVWWEEMTSEPPQEGVNWLGNKWTSASKEKMAHPNARFTAPVKNCPVLDPAFNSEEGVPIDAILFGGRRSELVPLVRQAFDWKHGVFLGATCCSEQTAAVMGQEVGKVRHDPFAMLPFCGYNMADYFGHWLSFEGRTQPEKLPKIFFVNWFKRGKHHEWLWPGFSENVRVLKWIFERTNNESNFTETPIGLLPKRSSFDFSGLSLTEETIGQLLEVNNEDWKKEMEEIQNYLSVFGDRLPGEIVKELKALKDRL